MPPITFQSLPDSVRWHIYTLSGITRHCSIPLTQQNPRPAIEHRIRSQHDCRYIKFLHDPGNAKINMERDCFYPPIPIEHMQVSKSIYQETHSIFYGENIFVVRAHHAEDLHVLSSLTDLTIRKLRRILIRLNCWPCPHGHAPASFTRNKCFACGTSLLDSDPPIRQGNGQSDQLIQEWKRIAFTLASNIVPGRLDLAFICDMEDTTRANRILEPFMGFPRLAACTIRLRRRPDDKLRSLARETSIILTTNPGLLHTRTLHFSFMSLPRELRLGVLKYTAYSTACECRTIPLEAAIFSRQMYLDAADVLYSTNTFIFKESLTASLGFFQKLQPASLKLLRRVEFYFNPSQTEAWVEQEEA
jgi:hypothetical protein